MRFWRDVGEAMDEAFLTQWHRDRRTIARYLRLRSMVYGR